MTLAVDLKHSFCFLLFLFLVSCTGDPKVFNFKGDAFGTFYDVKVITSEDKVEDIKLKIKDAINVMNDCCSTYLTNSLVSSKRDNRSIETFSDESRNIFNKVIDLSTSANRMTEGFILFDNFDYFNAVAKGYAVDLISNKFLNLNQRNFFINIGGEIRVQGQKINKFWKIGIEYPVENKKEIFKVIEPKQNMSIATSGNYKNPGHIVGLESKPLEENILSVSVIDIESTGAADALATGLYALNDMTFIQEKLDKFDIPAFIIFKNKNNEILSFESIKWKELLQ